ncbi:ATP-dependent helicase [Methanosarcina sp. KYL-1]|uniref:UvrD-helicase domain-containing protein n=1 Tax=Methanosarcina sp. KYL-1 TaxID=2602068 RepID=UPI002100E2CA|nr:ATP-dependent helicase [Methanosarcina sp. KYL-1]MCQ1534808.1 ATP-dependent helicase [Methanosarcina sp. KYL-1]
MDMNTCSDVYTMENIEHHFKVFAGPGAGKTKWLIDHIGRVSRESTRLGKTRKIACITYTNVAADEIKKRLNCDLYRIEVSTIHSFLYRNLIKPFSFLIENDQSGNPLVNVNEITGHVEHIPRLDRVSSWIEELVKLNSRKYGYLYNYLKNNEDKQRIYEYFPTMYWSLSGEQCELKFREPYQNPGIPIRNGELLLYKKAYWKYGILHHEDVLYFSHYIITNYPSTLDFIRARFPYIFIDEFQDTTQLQTNIIKTIAEKETTVGVIGDLAQSIYMFTGAQRHDFESFALDRMQNYKIEQNHRSSREIITYLNTLRTDIQQRKVETTIDIYPVTLLIGDIELAREWIKENCHIEPIILTRNNSKANELKNNLNGIESTYNLINELYGSDSDKKRPAFINSLLVARDYSIKSNNKDSIKEISKYLKLDKNGQKVSSLIIRKLSVTLINEMSDKDFMDKTIFDAYASITRLLDDYNIKIAGAYGRGNAKEFAKKHTLADLVPYIKTETKQEEMIRTIHSAKGAEFDSVLLVLEDEEEFKKWIVDCVNQVENVRKDEARIYYVAMSRAKNYLFINVPTLEDDSNLYEGFNIVYM